MTNEEREQQLVAAAMYYFGQRDAGLELRLSDVITAIAPDCRTDLIRLVAAVNNSRAGQPPDSEPWIRPAHVVLDLLQELRRPK
jgi:hypothetical protein